MKITAHVMAASPEYFSRIATIGKQEWECMGYSNTGNTVRFARLECTRSLKVRQINIYVNPDRIIVLP